MKRSFLLLLSSAMFLACWWHIASAEDDPELEVVIKNPMVVGVKGEFKGLPGTGFSVETISIVVDSNGQPIPGDMDSARNRLQHLANQNNATISSGITITGVDQQSELPIVFPLETQAAGDLLRLPSDVEVEGINISPIPPTLSIAEQVAQQQFREFRIPIFGGRIALAKSPNLVGVPTRNLFLTIVTSIATGATTGTIQVNYVLSQGLPAYAGIAAGIWVAAYEGGVQLRIQDYMKLIGKYGQSVRVGSAVIFVSGLQAISVLGGLSSFNNTLDMFKDAVLGGLIYIGSTERFYAYLNVLNKKSDGKSTPFQKKMNEFMNFGLTQAAVVTELLRQMELPPVANFPSWLPLLAHHEITSAMVSAGTLLTTGTILWIWEAHVRDFSKKMWTHIKNIKMKPCDRIYNMNILESAKIMWAKLFGHS